MRYRGFVVHNIVESEAKIVDLGGCSLFASEALLFAGLSALLYRPTPRVYYSHPMEMVLDEVCASCGNTRLPDGRFCLFCGDLLSEPGSATQAANSKSVASPPDPIEYAGFWLRVWAGCFDLCIEALGALLLTLLLDVILRRFGRGFGIDPWDSKVFTGSAFILILAVGSWLYCAFTESSSWRATIGKRLLGLQVISTDGSRCSFGQATERHLMKFLSLFILTIGFMMSGWTKRRQALHDMPCECLVIRVQTRSSSLLRR